MNDIGMCCSGLETVEFFEKITDIIPKEAKTEEFSLRYEKALNRVKYECYKGIGRPRKITKGVKAWHSDHKYCGVCGFGADEPHYKFCPNCGTRYLDSEYEQKTVKAHQMNIDEWLKVVEDEQAKEGGTYE